MTRQIIAWEGKEKIPGRLVEVGAIKWGKDPIPVVSSYSAWRDLDKVVGKATDIQRQEDGSLTAEIDYELPVGGGFSIFASHLDYDTDENLMTVRSCRLRQIFITAGVPWVRKEDN